MEEEQVLLSFPGSEEAVAIDICSCHLKRHADTITMDFILIFGIYLPQTQIISHARHDFLADPSP
jgi:hypothetical protein